MPGDGRRRHDRVDHRRPARRRRSGEIRVLDNFVRGRRANLAAALASGRSALIEGDIRDVDVVSDVTAGADLVFHQAAIRITQCAEEPRLALEVLADGTFNVLEAAAHAEVRKVVAASSASVYGLATEFPTTELQHPWANDTFYGAAKVFNEGMLRSFHAMHGLDYVALRYFNVYGPRMDIHGLYTEVLIRWMERIEAGLPPLDPRRRPADDGLRLHHRHRPGELCAPPSPTSRTPSSTSAPAPRPACSSWPRRCSTSWARDLAVEFGPARAVNGVTRRLASIDAAAQQQLGLEARGRPAGRGCRRSSDWWRAEQEHA